jgi:RimJ/RimL family protein N-acetyltransferase
MYKFVPIAADKERNIFENTQHLKFILDLFFRYKHLLADDSFPEDEESLILFLLDEMNSLYPWFMVGLENDIPVGFVWVTHWHRGKNNTYHSCQIQACIDKKFWGKTAFNISWAFINFLFNKIGVNRIQAEVPQNNILAHGFMRRLGFFKEGVIRCAGLKNGQSVNHTLFARIKPKYNKPLQNFKNFKK